MVFRSRRFKPYQPKASRAPTLDSLISKLDTAGLRFVIESVLEADRKLVTKLLDDARKTPFDGVTVDHLRSIVSTLVSKKRIIRSDLEAAIDAPRPTSTTPVKAKPALDFAKDGYKLQDLVIRCATTKMCCGVMDDKLKAGINGVLKKVKHEGHCDKTLLSAANALLYMGQILIDEPDAKDISHWDFDPITEAVGQLGARLRTAESLDELLKDIEWVKNVAKGEGSEYRDHYHLLKALHADISERRAALDGDSDSEQGSDEEASAEDGEGEEEGDEEMEENEEGELDHQLLAG